MDKTTLCLSKNWRFHLGDEPYAWQAWYDDSTWKEVTVPHDWSVEYPFSREYSSGRGYLAGGNGFLNEVELEYLPFAGKLITMEIGIRFLTDYLDGDVYFKTHRNNHNIDRCHTQFKLVESIEEQMDAMKMKVKETAKEYKA